MLGSSSVPLLRWSGLTPPPSEEDVTNGGMASESELGSGHLLLEEAVGGPGLEASPSVSAGGGAHWPKRPQLTQLKTFKFEAKLKVLDFELGAIGLLLWVASLALLRWLWISGSGFLDLAELNPEWYLKSFSTIGRGRTDDEQKWLMVPLWLALLLLVFWLLLF